MYDKIKKIELKDKLVFDLKVLKDKKTIFHFKNKHIILGRNEILPENIYDLDSLIIDTYNNEDNIKKIFEFEIKLNEKTKIFDHFLDEGEYIFGFKCLEIFKNNTKEKFDLSSNKKDISNEIKIKMLEEQIEKLKNDIIKMNHEKVKSEKIYVDKITEIEKTAIEKVEKYKEEIKEKAKKDLEDKSKYSIQKLVEDLLSPLNNLYNAIEFGVKAKDENVSAYVKGFQMIVTSIFSILENHKITIINPSIGETFNPELHEVIEHVNDDNYSNEKIVKVVSRGYKLEDRVLIPAKVIIVK